MKYLCNTLCGNLYKDGSILFFRITVKGGVSMNQFMPPIIPLDHTPIPGDPDIFEG
jgi:hypothetical protein